MKYINTVKKIKFNFIHVTIRFIKKRITKKKLKEFKINLILSVQTDFIFSKEILQLVNHMAFNLHMSLLPNYKVGMQLTIQY